MGRPPIVTEGHQVDSGPSDAVGATDGTSFRSAEAPAYLSGLDLAGRRVLVAGAGRVATRRIAGLLAAGADVLAVAPTASSAQATAAWSAGVSRRTCIRCRTWRAGRPRRRR